MLSDKLRIEFSDDGVTLEIGFHSRSVRLTPGGAHEACDTISGAREDEAAWALAKAQTALFNAVYHATAIFETLERAGTVSGNVYDIRQKIADMAVAELFNRWLDSAAPTPTPTSTPQEQNP